MRTTKRLTGSINVPGDKSISHRAIILGCLSPGQLSIDNYLDSEDINRTMTAFELMGVKINKKLQRVTILSEGFNALKPPAKPIDLGNSGTTARLLSGVLAAMPFETKLIGDASLSKRPMKRIAVPLEEMGVSFQYDEQEGYLPLTIQGNQLKRIQYEMPVASAQVKSAILLAGLVSEVGVSVIETNTSRDHTERMLNGFGIHLTNQDGRITLKGKQTLKPTDVWVPGDFSSAAFWIAAALITPDSEITIENVGLNPTRTGLLNVLERMGADIEVTHEGIQLNEPVGKITARYSTLKPTSLSNEEIPSLIDEIPILALITTQATGLTELSNIKELKFKETDRIHAIAQVLNELGANVTTTEDGLRIIGKTNLHGGEVQTYHDHRIAMMASIASLISDGEVEIDDTDCVSVSYPNFFNDLTQLQK